MNRYLPKPSPRLDVVRGVTRSAHGGGVLCMNRYLRRPSPRRHVVRGVTRSAHFWGRVALGRARATFVHIDRDRR